FAGVARTGLASQRLSRQPPDSPVPPGYGTPSRDATVDTVSLCNGRRSYRSRRRDGHTTDRRALAVFARQATHGETGRNVRFCWLGRLARLASDRLIGLGGLRKRSTLVGSHQSGSPGERKSIRRFFCSCVGGAINCRIASKTTRNCASYFFSR